ncbi:hypothetical protein NDU88_004274 [Pleurodeles waltl]|uniref:Uncharacterized protein n=1 Tax=Pleurodeles waltl TaxID=8319 RepID=A0AAV7MT04_PLEWA|nr:hypothetical protein NDU88_004274 [Pleurodeles waltl]
MVLESVPYGFRDDALGRRHTQQRFKACNVQCGRPCPTFIFNPVPLLDWPVQRTPDNQGAPFLLASYTPPWLRPTPVRRYVRALELVCFATSQPLDLGLI